MLAKRNIIFAIVLMIAAPGFVAAFLVHRATAAQIGSYDEETAYWKTEIERVGGETAHDEMVERYRALGAFDGHEYAHVFGAALYSVRGVAGFSDCGNEFVWGCAHSLTERAIAEHGLSVLETLNTTCLALPREDLQECQHGLGHGIMSHLGIARLTDALTECRTIGGTYGCASGVLMEYLNGNIHEGRAVTAYTEEGKYGPCESVPLDDRLICYRRLPNWWALVFRGNDRDRHMFLAKNCSEILQWDPRSACFIGIGYNETSDAGYDPDAGAAICDALADEHAALVCRWGGVLAIFQNTPVRDRAVRMCPSRDLAQCVTSAERLIGASEGELAFPQ